MQAGFYATPIFYPLTMVMKASPDAAKLMMLNPMAQIIQDARYAIISNQTPTLWSVVHNPFVVWVPFTIVIGVFVLGSVYFRRRSPHFAEEI